jgi:hypothetical protein
MIVKQPARHARGDGATRVMLARRIRQQTLLPAA